MRKKYLLGIGMVLAGVLAAYGSLEASQYVRTSRLAQIDGCVTQRNVYYSGLNARYNLHDCKKDMEVQPYRPYTFRRAPFRRYQQAHVNDKGVARYYGLSLADAQDLYPRYKIPTRVYSHKERQGIIDRQYKSLDLAAVGARRANLRPSDKIVIRNNNYKYYNMEDNPAYQAYILATQGEDATDVLSGVNVQEDDTLLKREEFLASLEPVSYDFGVTTPAGFAETEDGYLRHARLALAYKVTSVEDICAEMTFGACVDHQQKSFSARYRIAQKKQIFEDVRMRPLVSGSDKLHPVYMETFVATSQGMKYVHFHFVTIDPATGSLIRIEAITLPEETAAAAQVMHDVFQSFQFVKAQK